MALRIYLIVHTSYLFLSLVCEDPTPTLLVLRLLITASIVLIAQLRWARLQPCLRVLVLRRAWEAWGFWNSQPAIKPHARIVRVLWGLQIVWSAASCSICTLSMQVLAWVLPLRLCTIHADRSSLPTRALLIYGSVVIYISLMVFLSASFEIVLMVIGVLLIDDTRRSLILRIGLPTWRTHIFWVSAFWGNFTCFWILCFLIFQEHTLIIHEIWILELGEIYISDSFNQSLHRRPVPVNLIYIDHATEFQVLQN